MTTVTDVRRMAEYLDELLHEHKHLPPEAHLVLGEWRPGDGRTRYRLALHVDGCPGETHVWESWLGAAKAYEGLRCMVWGVNAKRQLFSSLSVLTTWVLRCP